MTDALLTTVHAGTAAVWLGAMLYSLIVVQPRAAAALEDPEPLFVSLAAGARWKVIAMCAVLAASGAGLIAIEDDAPTAWAVLVGVKSALLIAALALFAHVSWRMWPARLFALPEEVPAHRRRFRAVALTLTTLVGTAFVLGTVADTLR
jgi:putative copper export protein